MTNAPKFEAFLTKKNGKPAVELVVRNATTVPYLDTLTMILGYEPTADIANRRGVVCTTPEEIDAARNPLMGLFDAQGNYKGL